MGIERPFFDRQPIRIEATPSQIERGQIKASKEQGVLHYSTNRKNGDDEYTLAEVRGQLKTQTPQAQGSITDPELPDSNPHTFKEMLEPNKGDNPLQRLAKWYIKPRGNPETVIKVLEALQVHQFQKLPKLLSRLSTRGGRYQSAYTVKDSRLSSLIDYAVNQSTINEAIHVGIIIGINTQYIDIAVATGSEVGLAVGAASLLFNTYCILAQRYSRARCERLIDKSLARGKTIDYDKYNNLLNLQLPQSNPTNR